jgi:outer membrane protein insertion porin family
MKNYLLNFLLKVIFILIIIPTSGFATNSLGAKRSLFKIKKIEIEGNNKVEKQAILGRISAKVGATVTNYTVRDDIDRIYKMNYFEWIEVHQDANSVLRIVVKEKPLISSVSFAGNDEIDSDDLEEVIKTKDFGILDVNKVKEDVFALKKHYEEKGYYLARVNYVIDSLPNGNVDVRYQITEFDKVKVKKITFLGNKVFTDFQLKDLMETREDSFFGAMSGAGSYKEFNFQTDIERIKYFYKTKGYLQVNIGNPEVTISEDRRWIFITAKINEGPEFKINSVLFYGDSMFSDDDLREMTKLREGDIYSEEKLRIDIKNLTEAYQDKGYAFANVLRTLEVVPGENKIDLTFSFEKGKLAHFGHINIKGNHKTRDKVIRRELTIKEGGTFSGTDLRLSRENVNRLGFFEPGSVVFNTVSRPGRDDIIDIEITVKERNTGQISLGAGYSTATGAFLQASVAQNNFLGKGQNLSLSLSLSKVNKTYNLGFTEPYLYDTLWTAGGDIYSQNNNASASLSYKRQGFDLRLGYPILEYTRLFGTYKFEDTSINSVNDPTIDEDLENGLASMVRVSTIRDLRNNKFEPSSGYYLSLSSEYAGLGGVKKWFKLELDSRYFHRVYGDLVFRSRLYASRIYEVDDRKIPRTEKFTLGGARNLRGYPFEGIGPKLEVETDNGSVVYNKGGEFAAYTSLELEHPLAREAGLKWVVFFDAGDAGAIDNFNLYMDYGFGLRWFSPIGVLRFEWGFPINTDETTVSDSQFFFDIGQLF